MSDKISEVDIKISELESLENINDEDLVLIVDSANNATKKTTVGNLRKKMLPNLNWTSATLNSDYVSNGTVKYSEFNGIVFLKVCDLVLSNDVSNDVVLAEGLPNKEYFSFLLQQYYTHKSLRIRITNGKLMVNYDSATASGIQWYGTALF